MVKTTMTTNDAGQDDLNPYSLYNDCLPDDHMQSAKVALIPFNRSTLAFPPQAHHKETLPVFRENSARAPSWVFLYWTSQLLAMLKGDEGPTVLPLLERMAQDYQQAIFYPFRVSIRIV
jgi:hypothetical protein